MRRSKHSWRNNRGGQAETSSSATKGKTYVVVGCFALFRRDSFVERKQRHASHTSSTLQHRHSDANALAAKVAAKAAAKQKAEEDERLKAERAVREMNVPTIFRGPSRLSS